MLRPADAARSHVDLAGIGLGIGDEFRNGFRREVRQHFHDQSDAIGDRDRRDVVHEVERQIGKHRLIDGVLRIDQEQRVAIGRRMHGRFGRDIAGGAGPDIDDELLAEMVAQILADEARVDVGRTARGLPDRAGAPAASDSRARRAAGRGRDRWQDRRSRAGQRKFQKIAAFHALPPLTICRPGVIRPAACSGGLGVSLARRGCVAESQMPRAKAPVAS